MSDKITFTSKRKLSVKEIVGDDVRVLFRKALAKDENLKQLDLCKVGGVCHSFVVVPTTFGEATRLVGEFQAISMLDGEVYRSNRLFLPDMLSEQITSHLKQLQNQGGGNVEFALMISVIPDAKCAAGYVYIAEPVIKAKETEAMEAISKALGIVKALPAPEDKGTGKGKK